MEKGKLYLVATPIGNLDDITFRAVNVLKSVDIIAAEDTRHSLKLLNPLGILEKGYSVVKTNDKVVKDASTLKIGDNLNIKMHNGQINAKVMEVLK